MSTKRQQLEVNTQPTQPVEFGDTIFNDIKDMHLKFKVYDTVSNLTPEAFVEYLRFRLRMVKEEYDETEQALADGDAEEFVDGIIDLMVFAAGTLDVIGVDAQKAWDAVHKANMKKTVGTKSERFNEFGFPDLVKPKSWKAPSHKGNHGLLDGLQFGDPQYQSDSCTQQLITETEA